MIDPLTEPQREREACLYAAIRLTLGDDRYDAMDAVDLAEYIRAGVRGLPFPDNVVKAAAGVIELPFAPLAAVPEER